MSLWPQYTIESLGNLTPTQQAELLDDSEETISFRSMSAYQNWLDNHGR